jgi:hypothetical protein
MMAKIEDLTDNLTDDPGGATLKQAQRLLADMLQRLRALMDAGLPPEEFTRARQLTEAALAAETACLAYWEKYNK